MLTMKGTMATYDAIVIGTGQVMLGELRPL
jgi:hypothetical protein